MHEQNSSLLQALKDCSVECNHCYHACFQEEDLKMMAKCIQLDRNCADICDLTASWIASGSDHAKHLLKECADVCQACADECEKHAHMEHCKRCAEVCRRCAEECRNALVS